MDELRMTTARSASQRRRRGIALLLVLAVLAGVTVLTAGALTMQQSAPDVGVNAVSEVRARWSAESAANISVAVLQTSFDFAGANGDMMKNQSVTGGDASVTITNSAGDPPTADDRELVLTSTSVVNSVKRTVRKVVSLTPKVAPSAAVDPYYNEFGILAATDLGIAAGATVGRWYLSPEAVSARPVGIGVAMSSGSKVVIDPSAYVRDAALYSSSSADTSLAAATASPSLASGGWKIPYTLPVAPELRPASMASLADEKTNDLVFTGAAQSVTLVEGKYQRLLVEDGAVITIGAAGGAKYSFDRVELRNQGVLLVKGQALVELRERLEVTKYASVALADDSSAVAFFTDNDVLVNDAAIGVDAAVATDPARSIKNIASYVRPSRVRFYAQPSSTGGTATPQYQFESNALVVACVHSPTAAITLRDGASIIGRLTGASVSLASGTSLYYDPCLDPRTGFSAKSGPLYDSDGAPLADLATTLAGFNTAAGASALTVAVRLIPSLDSTTGAVAALSEATLSVESVTAVTTEQPADRTSRTVEVRALPDLTGI